ncbi:MAG TPA: bifunctional adenosylcobinamide kinase/adenosylcobinamide-phosphate guanylyltransferase, partial [Marinagarivorans sp.]|nr:bifunctional adenosylcobinamide kinase/adenosylcobinamide-phosphate guanylyltransferase [Marinagarivorans sp.]
MPTCLYLGGARSGKSRLAQTRAEAHSAVTVIVTAEALDGEMAQRIRHHQTQRPQHWQVLEAPLQLGAALLSCQARNEPPLVLVDCLTLWLSNLLCLEDDKRYQLERTNFLQAVTKQRSPLLLVSNEVGLGLIAPTPLGRLFVDEAGRLHQELAGLCDEVIWVAAGLPLW